MIEFSILQNTRIGRNCIIQPGVVIGADGFTPRGILKQWNLKDFHILVELIIRDNVEICPIAL